MKNNQQFERDLSKISDEELLNAISLFAIELKLRKAKDEQ